MNGYHIFVTDDEMEIIVAGLKSLDYYNKDCNGDIYVGNRKFHGIKFRELVTRLKETQTMENVNNAETDA